ncbi:D-Ala-D-Ala carboxypeptidase family metallohydrolase [Phenylobacterium sp.]|uniref:D-Ala-D-Ala carboxypeptidase family metallohydrolase n=1 Tax=Phenylobacterium sp. TaxID=1871053 RepID=UPI002DF1870D|nr:D-Ala-D-Ala carboxypeptidase family metallohydrolase [Phenylobacterium sp.]
MLLSPHFSLEELTATSHRELDNTPTPEVATVLADTALRMEAVRTLLGGEAIHINSGYRSIGVNHAVGGVPNSAHLTGHACDFICPAFGAPLEICRALAASAISFDQVIEEGTWVHISFAPTLRRQVLTKKAGGGYALGLPEEG